MGKDLKGKELGTGITQRKNGRYLGRYVNRFGKRESVHAGTLSELRRKLAEAIAEDSNRNTVVDKNIKVNEWYEKWMRVYKEPVVRVSTKTRYMDLYKSHIKPFIGNCKLNEVTKLMLTEMINDMYNRGYQWETMNQVKVLLTDIFNRALDDDFIVKNPIKGVKLPIPRPEFAPKAMTVEEQKEFFECAAGTFYNNLFVVAINTGLRPGELFALTENSIDFKNKEIHVTQTLSYQKIYEETGKKFYLGDPKTRCSNRVIPINSFCQIALEKQIMQRNIILNRYDKKCDIQYPELLFRSSAGQPLCSQTYNDAIKRIVDQINMMRDPLDYMERFSGHCFRHTFATRCFEAGVSPKTVQTYLGHATLQMTMDLYTNVLTQKKKDDMKLLEDNIGLREQYMPEYDSKAIHFNNMV